MKQVFYFIALAVFVSMAESSLWMEHFCKNAMVNRRKFSIAQKPCNQT